MNDKGTGSPSRGFDWPGKVRHYVCGSRGFTVAYGLDRLGTIQWADGWHPVEMLYESPAHETGAAARTKVKVYRVSR